MPERTECLLFVYGTLLKGEPQHALLGESRLIAEATTLPAFSLVDLGRIAALVRGGSTAVVGELYAIDLQVRRTLDVERQVPILFNREKVQLADGTEAEAYVLPSDKARGKRRLAQGDWKKRFSRSINPNAGGAWVQWSRGRWKS
ncbi:MAG TPA: gamma-glutamylcyclotransferase family protein [Polyangiaceae bacterium]|nr:gamma-glutamylcyclotransferase family protein [Polyangiaceae bacterium]